MIAIAYNNSLTNDERIEGKTVTIPLSGSPVTPIYFKVYFQPDEDKTWTIDRYAFNGVLSYDYILLSTPEFDEYSYSAFALFKLIPNSTGKCTF